jgi:hypothetical protein
MQSEVDKTADQGGDVKNVRVFVLLGGLIGIDGVLTSAGMFGLASQIRALGATVSTHLWSNWPDVRQLIEGLPLSTRVVLVGYSGGGSRATYVARAVMRPIDLVVAYDPSPAWQMRPLPTTVLRAVCYHNNLPLMFGLGGGHLTGAHTLVTQEISEPHLLVQVDQRLHSQTLAEISRLGGTSGTT